MFTLLAQKKQQVIDMKNIKSQSYLINARMVNCDSTSGSMMEYRICANLQLQLQDSLMHMELDSMISEYRINKDTSALSKLMNAQEVWEKYRYAHCDTYTSGERSSLDPVMFMRCAAEITMERRKNLRKDLSVSD